MLRRIRKVAQHRDDLIAKEKAKQDADRVLNPPAEGEASPARRRRRSETTEEAAE
jgi:DNA-directed RNA polymerase subunit beta'